MRGLRNQQKAAVAAGGVEWMMSLDSVSHLEERGESIAKGDARAHSGSGRRDNHLRKNFGGRSSSVFSFYRVEMITNRWLSTSTSFV